MSTCFLFIACLLFGLSHFFSAIKSGCFYAAMRGDLKNKKLAPFIQNLHRIQSPFWYSLFGALFFVCLAIFSKDLEIWPGLKKLAPLALRALIITMATSASFGVFYQGAVNWGAGRPFIDPDEKRSFEIALKDISVWIPKFWYGKNRITISVLGAVVLIYAIFFW